MPKPIAPGEPFSAVAESILLSRYDGLDWSGQISYCSLQNSTAGVPEVRGQTWLGEVTYAELREQLRLMAAAAADLAEKVDISPTIGLAVRVPIATPTGSNSDRSLEHAAGSADNIVGFMCVIATTDGRQFCAERTRAEPDLVVTASRMPGSASLTAVLAEGVAQIAQAQQRAASAVSDLGTAVLARPHPAQLTIKTETAPESAVASEPPVAEAGPGI